MSGHIEQRLKVDSFEGVFVKLSTRSRAAERTSKGAGLTRKSIKLIPSPL